MAAFVSSPFEHVAGAVPANGAGLDPSLQNPYMVAHPPVLYLGYVSFAMPFAFAMAALITGRTDARWLASVRRWTLVRLGARSASACCSARTGRTSRSAGAATGRGIRSRTPR